MLEEIKDSLPRTLDDLLKESIEKGDIDLLKEYVSRKKKSQLSDELKEEQAPLLKNVTYDGKALLVYLALAEDYNEEYFKFVVENSDMRIVSPLNLCLFLTDALFNPNRKRLNRFLTFLHVIKTSPNFTKEEKLSLALKAEESLNRLYGPVF